MRTFLKLDSALSMENGICFYSKKHPGYMAVSTIDSNGDISTLWTSVKRYRKRKKNTKKKSLSRLAFMLGLAILVLLCIIFDFQPVSRIRLYTIYGIVECVVLLVLDITRISKTNLCKFHSAEHMVINAYYKLKSVPSLEEIREYSRFSNDCGGNSQVQAIIYFISILICTFIPDGFVAILVFLIINIFTCILWATGGLNFIQNFTTATPTDTELKVAISGMKTWLEHEQLGIRNR